MVFTSYLFWGDYDEGYLELMVSSVYWLNKTLEIFSQALAIVRIGELEFWLEIFFGESLKSSRVFYSRKILILKKNLKFLRCERIIY